MKSLQEIFDTVFNHFITEKQPFSFEADSEGVFEVCKYRGPGGSKCAAGLFIPDDEYNPEMEFAALRTLLAIPGEEKRISKSLMEVCGGPFAPFDYATIDASPNFKLMDALQQAHDKCASNVPQEGDYRCRQYFVSDLRNIAASFNLTFPTTT